MSDEEIEDVRIGATMAHTLEERVEYLLAIARVFIAAPDDESEPYQECGLLYSALVAACERLGFAPQAVIDEALGVGDVAGALGSYTAPPGAESEEAGC